MGRGSKIIDNLFLGQSKVLTKISLGYDNDVHISSNLFPIVPVETERIIVPEYAKDHLRRREMRRALRADTMRIKPGQITPHEIVLDEYSLDMKIDHREIDAINSSDAGLDLLAHNTKVLTDAIHLEVECQVADIAQTLSNYPTGHKTTLTGNDQWTDVDSKPLTQIQTGIDTLRGKGIKANTLIFGLKSWQAFRNHAQVITQVHGANNREIVTLDHIYDIFDGIDNIVVGGDFLENPETGTFTDIWQDNLIIARVPQTKRDQANYYTMSAGYTFVYKGEEQPQVTVFWENDAKKNLIIDVKKRMTPALLKAEAMYILNDTNA